jgi:hypothetical protein
MKGVIPHGRHELLAAHERIERTFNLVIFLINE